MNLMVINSEDSAFNLLKQFESLTLDEQTRIEFSGWPVFELRIIGEDFHGSIPTRVMPPILELQKEIRRLYCLLKYNTENVQKLTEQDRRDTEIVVRVELGSSIFLAELGKIFNQILRNPKVDGSHVTIMVVSIAALMTTSYAWKDWLNAESEKNLSNHSVQMSQQETERMKVLGEIIQQQSSEIRKTVEGIDQFRYDLSRRLDDSDKLFISQQQITTGEIAKEVTSKPRATAIDVRIDGLFTILSVDSGALRSGYKLKVRDISTKQEYMVAIPDGTLTKEKLEAIKEMEWGKQHIYLRLNAKKSMGVYRNITLVDAQLTPP